jgi:hypothetical protein
MFKRFQNIFIQLNHFSNQYNKIVDVIIKPSAILHPMFKGNLKLTPKCCGKSATIG